MKQADTLINQKGKNWVLPEALCLLEGGAIVRTLEPKMHIIS